MMEPVSTIVHSANSPPAKTKKTYKWDIVWINVFLLSALHAIAIYGLFYRFKCPTPALVFTRIVALISTLGVTGGAHRLWCHKSYKANYFVQVFLAISMSLVYQNSIYTWCRDHRVHHKYSETDADPHNAKRGFFFSHVGWLLVKKHKDVKEKGKTIDMSDLEANPIVMFQHKYYYPIVFFFALLLPTAIPCYVWDIDVITSFASLTVYRYIVSVNFTWCINSFAHLYGTKPYDKNIGPTENPMMKILGTGEGFHNYHHTFPWDYKAAELGNDFRNLTTLMIDFFAWCGWVTDRKTVDPDIIMKRSQRTGDGTLNKDNFNLYQRVKTSLMIVLFWSLI